LTEKNITRGIYQIPHPISGADLKVVSLSYRL